MKSKSKVAVTLLRFANARERAYRSVGALVLAQMRAIAKIRSVAGYFTSAPEAKQANAVIQVKDELMLILPPTMSRFSKQREQILQLIEISHA